MLCIAAKPQGISLACGCFAYYCHMTITVDSVYVCAWHVLSTPFPASGHSKAASLLVLDGGRQACCSGRLVVQAMKELMVNDALDGVGGLGATDPEVMAKRIAQQALRCNPPRHYLAGWLSWPLYLCGCYAPCWLVDWLQIVRLRLFPCSQCKQQ